MNTAAPARDGTTTVHRQCTLCEAHCGITVEVEGANVLRIAGDRDDPMSRGYICPKAAALTDLYTDPDRLSRPVRRTAGGWEEMGWDEALDFAAAGLRRVRERHGRDSLATYIGNPTAHSWSVLSAIPLRETMDTRNHYSATSTDQLPQHRSSAEMFGNLALFPIPDIDRTDFLLVLGANPSVSNGSLMTAPPRSGGRATASTSGRCGRAGYPVRWPRPIAVCSSRRRPSSRRRWRSTRVRGRPRPPRPTGSASR